MRMQKARNAEQVIVLFTCGKMDILGFTAFCFYNDTTIAYMFSYAMDF